MKKKQRVREDLIEFRLKNGNKRSRKTVIATPPAPPITAQSRTTQPRHYN